MAILFRLHDAGSMDKIRGMVAPVVAALVLFGCQTSGGDEEPSGAVIGGTGGAIMGAFTGVGTGVGNSSLLGALIGGVVGAVAGDALIGTNWTPLQPGDRAKADAAARQAAGSPDGGRVHWNSDNDPKVFGWAEPLPPMGREETTQCRQVKSIHYPTEHEQVEITLFCRDGEQWVASKS